MKNNEFVIDTQLQLPYNIIDISSAYDEHFVFRFLRFDEGQTEYSVKNRGITGEFGIEYHGRGMDCDFSCDITMESVRDFFLAVESEYDGMGSGTVMLQDYSADNRTMLIFTRDRHGHFRADGKILNKDARYESGLVFAFDFDSGCILDTIRAGGKFFHEMYRLRENKE